MLFNNKYAYTDFHELNADFLLAKVQELDNKVNTELMDTIEKYIAQRLSEFVLHANYDEATETINLYLEEE